MSKTKTKKRLTHPVRFWFMVGALLSGFVLLGTRAFILQVIDASYLKYQGAARHVRTVDVVASRGMVLDRNGAPLAISTPVDSVWANPKEFADAKPQWPSLAKLLGMRSREIGRLWQRYADREFMYLKRHINPEIAKKIRDLNIPGVGLRREYKRYYPTGAVSGHVVGFTNVDDTGQEGIELAFDEVLRGQPGKQLVLKDGRRHVIKTLRRVRAAVDGNDVTTSLDSRIQYLAFRALRAAVHEHKARSASAVVLDAKTGEVLAMVNVPSFNPNNRRRLRSGNFRNRAVTDVLEPGSTVKPFTIAAALESRGFEPDTPVETGPGMLRIGKHTVRDTHDYGLLSVAHVIMKSSNVGATKIALEIDKQDLWQIFRGVGFGAALSSGLPGEARGRLNSYKRWREIEHATMAYGYGFSITPLHLAQAYTVLANDGQRVPVTLLRRDRVPDGTQVLSARTVRQVRDMLELAVSDEGTGRRARTRHYRVAGKTGTVHKLIDGRYSADRYRSVFAGIAPASAPRLVMAVVVDDPTGGRYFGGEVAAPVFSKVMAGALRFLNIAPDSLPAVDEKMMARVAGETG